MITDLRVLVVDDQESMRMLAVSALKAMGISDVAVAGDGERALKIIEEGRTHIVILDIEMPKMDGFETLSRIRANAKTKDQAVIMMTGRSDMEMVLKIMAMKVVGYLVKPVSSAKLHNAINAYLAKQKSE